MTTDPIAIFSGITLTVEDNGLLEQANGQLFSESNPTALEQARQPHALMVPKEIRTTPQWEGYYDPETLQPLSLTTPGSRSDIREIMQVVQHILHTMAELHHQGLGLGMLTAGRLWQNEEGALRIAGFHLVRPSTDILNLLQLSNEDLAYLPPEYSNQVAQLPDHRADFYSLGVLLFRWLTGVFPFSGADGLEVIHQHLSLQPEKPSRLNPHVPPILDAMVLCMLEKSPDARYQSAEGILEDVGRSLQADVATDGSSLHQTYSPGVLQIRNTLYGRREELQALSTAVQDAREGQEQFVRIGGYSGVGKTALAQAVQNDLAAEPHFYLAGKFDQFQNAPYAAWITAFEDLVQQLLFLPESDMAVWREKIQETLGENGGVLAEVVPNLEWLIGKQPEPEPLSPMETQTRFSYLFLQFCRLFAQPEHPLVLFIDDWQWCDIPSIQLLKQLLEEGLHHLMVIAAYRDNEIHPGHPFSILCKELEQAGVATQNLLLKNLEEVHVNTLLSEAMDEAPEYTAGLAALIYKKTGGNAFFTRQFLLSLRERKLLAFDFRKNQWQWEEELIVREDVSDNMLELMAGKIATLSEPAQALLKIAAFVGSDFNLKLLSIASQLDVADCQKYLHPVEKAGLAIPLKNAGRDGEVKYCFVHDQVQQAAYALELPNLQHDAASLHYLIGKSLLQSERFAGVPPSEKAAHFLKALDLIEDRLSEDVLSLFIEAGARANDSNSPKAAHGFFQAAHTLVQQEDSRRLDILKGLMQAAFLMNEVETAEGYAAQAINAAPTAIAKSEVYVLQLMFYESLALFEKNIYTGIKALKLFDIDIKDTLNNALMESLVQEQYYDFQQLMEGKQPRGLIQMPPLKDARESALLDILVNMNASAYFVDLYLFAWCTLRMGNQTLRHGQADSTPFAFVFLGSLLVALYQQFDLGYRFGKTGIEMLGRLDSNRYHCRTLSIFSIFIQHFKEPILNSIPVLKESVHAGLETGDAPYAGYSMYAQVRDLFLAGNSLDKATEACQSSIAFMEKANNAGLLALMKLFRANLRLLTGGYDEITAREEKESLSFLKEIKFFTAVAHHYIFKSWALCILGRYEEAWGWLDKNQAILIYASSQSHVPKHYFLRSLILLRTGDELEKEEQNTIAANQKVLYTWSESMPDNFQAEYEIIEALRAHRAGNWPQILKHFKEAVSWAQKGKLPGVEALAYELCGAVMEEGEVPELTAAYLAKASQVYWAWGAREKLMLLKEKLPEPATVATERTGQPLDYDTRSLLKATQAISAEVNKGELIKRLLHLTMENAGAEKGVLVLQENEGYFVEAEIDLNTKSIKTLNQQPLGQSEAVPQQLIRYAVKTKKEVVLEQPEHFLQMKDAYFQENAAKSALALPIQKQQELIGVLYLENSHLAGVFNKNRLEMLRAIASQAAISIVNTRLFEQTNRLNERLIASREELQKMNELLEERIRDRTKILREEIETRKAMEVQLKQAKEAADDANLAKSQFLANMSHEIRSPLNAIVGFAQILINQSHKLKLPAEFKKYLSNIKISGQNLSELINDILDLSKIEAGKMTLSEEDMSLKQLVQSLYHINKATAKEKGIDLQYDFAPATPKFIWSDRSKLKQILMNLLSNAIKFTPEGKQIFLKTEFSNNRIMFEVRDEGIGISQEQQAAIFEPFVQADARITREYQGTGLGLAITRNMVDMLGGSIELESELGKGSTFRVWLPYQKPVRITTEQAEILLDKIQIPASARILVVEDNPMNQEMIKAFFNEMNHDILVAHDGPEGVAMAGQYQPSLILMDIHMPGMDGFEAMRRIRKKNKDIPIIALSADAFTEQQERAIKAGFNDYITKPIQVTRVMECLQKYLIKGENKMKIEARPLSDKDRETLRSILQQLEQTPVFETEKLVERLEATAALTQANWREAMFDAVYAGDEGKIEELINGLKERLSTL